MEKEAQTQRRCTLDVPGEALQGPPPPAGDYGLHCKPRVDLSFCLQASPDSFSPYKEASVCVRW